MAEKSYKDHLESVANYNSRLLQQRRARIPAFDPNTGMLFQEGRRTFVPRDRRKGTDIGEIFSYPRIRWKLKIRPQASESPQKSTTVASEQKAPNLQTFANNVQNGSSSQSVSSSTSTSFPVQLQSNAGLYQAPPEINLNVAPAPGQRMFEELAKEMSQPIPQKTPQFQHQNSREKTEKFDDYEDKDEDMDDDDYDDSSSKKKKNKGPSKAGKARKDVDYTVTPGTDKPYSCNYCPMTYKTRPGLTYHVTKEHPNGQSSQPSSKQLSRASSTSSNSNLSTMHPAPMERSSGNRESGGRALKCDVCESERPSGKPPPRGDRLITCSTCGHSAHMSCLSFSKNQRESTQRYPWKCIECKVCSVCNLAGNDEKLLFCDDCDRGYHMYCVNPPLEHTPEGSWSCDGCLVQYGEEAAFRIWKRKMQQDAVARYQMELHEAARRGAGGNSVAFPHGNHQQPNVVSTQQHPQHQQHF